MVYKKDIVRKIAADTGLTHADVERVIDGTLSLIISTLSCNDEVHFTNFGTFKVQMNGARTFTHPNTKEKCTIPPKLKPVFKPAEKLKELVAATEL